MVLTDGIIMICACHQQELAYINDKLAILESSGDQPRPVFNKKKRPVFGKKRKFKGWKSFSFADFYDDAPMVSTEWKTEEPHQEAAEKMLTDLEHLQASVDDDFFGMFSRRLNMQSIVSLNICSCAKTV